MVEVVLEVLCDYLRGPQPAPSEHAAVEPQQHQGTASQPHQEEVELHDTALSLASGGPGAASHRDRVPEVEAEVHHAPGHLLLVGEGELHGGERDVVTLDQPLLAHCQEHRAIWVAVEALGGEARPHLVINLVFNLKTETVNLNLISQFP